MRNRYRFIWLAFITAILYWGLTAPIEKMSMRFPMEGLQLSKGWKWHPGDTLAWARPEFDDSQWPPIDPTQDVMDLSQIQDGKIVWMRLRISLDTVLPGKSLALKISHVGASEVYVNGQLIKRFGALNASSVKAGCYSTFLGLPISRSNVLIAIRGAFQKGLPYNRFGSVPNFFFNASLVPVEEVENFNLYFIGTMMAFAFTKVGAFLLLFFLHFTFYTFYPVQKANLYFSGMALCYGIHILMWVLFVYNKPMDNLPLILYCGLLRGPVYTLTYLLLLRALFALFNYKPDFIFWSTVACCIFLLVLFYTDYYNGVRLSEVWTTNISALACFYVAIKALLDKKRNALLILCGMVLSMVALEIRYLIHLYGYFPQLWKGHIASLLDFIGVMSIPLCISWFLGENFAFINRSLSAKLIEIQQLASEKQQLLISQKENLERQVAERTREIETQSRLIEAQHIRQLETEFEQKLADTEMTALRAQMNPHFIFNCLNSIKLYTLENDAERASEYLTKFSRLIRLVLENSRSELVTLHNELEALRLYIELEAMRFKHKLQYSIQVDPAVDQQYLRIPPLLLQPYVENAIWHGLMHKPEGGIITIEIEQPHESLLHIEITDDGIGRQRAAELKSKSAGKHKSFGMQVTADRIRMINQLYNMQTQARIEDLVDSFGEACGTRVTLEIPV
ncbi:Sensor protein lytS [Fibrisoma limi BUZ 3]|uniref:Sensor protein lytS n=1 Tax=Fibrisoma limi BUZ 3 TaxID=1185876 RepID=I2GRE1_9BACT|nr:histidine kinase [Fibrisoma limi]CCH56469.1 Sensor protein lytS [Fibrisoma limi BUZ 3]